MGPRVPHGNDFSGAGESVLQFRDAHGNVTINNAAPEPRPAPAVPFQVPAAPFGFVNRAAELLRFDQVAAQADDSTAVLVCLGVRGIGKSAAIRKWALRARDRFPGGQLYVDFTRLADGPRGDAVEALRTVLRSLGVEDAYLPATLPELSGLYLSRTAGQAVLVVVEGADEPANVRLLIPNAPGSAVIAASDAAVLDELAFDGARFLTFEPLTTDAACELLAATSGRSPVAPHERDPLRRLARLCGGHPLALTVSAARLALDPGLSAAELAAELSDEGNRLRALSLRDNPQVTAAFNVAYQRLSAESAALYRRLGLWPGQSFDLALAAVAAQNPRVGPLVGSLVAAGLLEPLERRCYRFRHDLVRLHARDLAAQEEPLARGETKETRETRETLRRLLAHYLTRLAFADRRLMGARYTATDRDRLVHGHTDPFEDSASALAWLVAQRSDIVAAVNASAQAGFTDLAWQLAETATALYLNRRYLADWIETGLVGADAAGDAGAVEAEARLRTLVSRPLTDLGRLAEAGAQLDRAHALVADSGHLVLRASVAEFHGRYLDQVDPARAAEVYQESRRLNQEAGEPRGAALALFFLGCSRSAAGAHAEAVPTLEAALTEFRGLTAYGTHGDERMAGRALFGLGRALEGAGRTAEAADRLGRAVAALAQGGHTYYEAQAREALADVLEAQGTPDAARPHLARALEIHEDAGSPRARELAFRLDQAR